MRSTPRPDKVEEVEKVRALLERSNGVIFTEYKGLSFVDVSSLRAKLRESNAEYHVVKNTLFRRAAEGLIADNLEEILQGPTATAFMLGDEAACAKAITSAQKDLKALVVKGTVLSGKLYPAATVVTLSKLPTRETLVAQVVGGIQAPISGAVNTLNGIITGFVTTLQNIVDEKSKTEAA